jgi:cyclopropane fatty-acyl-phospholipid synthase-like methyltransferase
MTDRPEGEKDAYKSVYATFNSPLSRKLRQDAYGEDIGQHSWVTADELRGDIASLRLSPSHRLLDLGCGPGGPLCFAVSSIGCRGAGLELSDAAVTAARERAASQGLDHLATFQQADLDAAIPLKDGSFEAVMSLDVVLHLRDREALFREVARVLTPGGHFLFTDAGLLTGSISSDEVAARSAHGRTHIVPPSFNEEALERAGLRLLESEDRTASVAKNADGRLRARLAHRAELERSEGAAGFDRQQRYLECVVALSRRHALSRMMYLAERR